MENAAKKSSKTRINKIVIDDNFKDYRNDKFFVKKLDDFNEFIERVGLPPEYYESGAIERRAYLLLQDRYHSST